MKELLKLRKEQEERAEREAEENKRRQEEEERRREEQVHNSTEEDRILANFRSFLKLNEKKKESKNKTPSRGRRKPTLPRSRNRKSNVISAYSRTKVVLSLIHQSTH